MVAAGVAGGRTVGGEKGVAVADGRQVGVAIAVGVIVGRIVGDGNAVAVGVAAGLGVRVGEGVSAIGIVAVPSEARVNAFEGGTVSTACDAMDTALSGV